MLSAGKVQPKACSEYLVLLSICESCKYKGVSFIDFLRSRESDVNTFADARQGDVWSH